MTEAATSRFYWLHALGPVHVGVGRGTGYIDLPIMREKVTNWPLIPGSAIKGVLSRHYGADQQGRSANQLHRIAFGVADDIRNVEGGANSGSLVFADGRVVCLPIRSLYGTFSWCTSPMVLRRIQRELTNTALVPEPPQPMNNEALICENSVLQSGARVYLEDLDLEANSKGSQSSVVAWAKWLAENIFSEEPWRKEFLTRFAILHDDVFNFLCEYGTEVTARIRIDDEKKTVVPGALWYEESLPAETILGGLVWCDRVFARQKDSEKLPTKGELLSKYCPAGAAIALQLGGKATVGRGRIGCRFTETK